MKSKSYILSFLLSVFFVKGRFSQAEGRNVSSSVHVAMCRARCRDKFVTNKVTTVGITTNSQCTSYNSPDCFMCWETCEIFQQNFTVWGSMCGDPVICFPGCNEACGFHKELSTKSLTKLVATELSEKLPWTFKSSLLFQSFGQRGVLISWSRPSPSPESPNSSNIVYILLKRTRSKLNKEWLQITQTSELTTVVEEMNIGKKIDVKLLAVSAKGLIAETSAIYVPKILKELPIADEEPRFKPWQMKVESMKYNPQLSSVDVIISWVPPETGDFIVIWEIIDGSFDVKGHLYTKLTTVTLTLSTDTLYYVQVELKSLGIKSESLIIDSKRIDASFNNEHPHFSKTFNQQTADKKEVYITEIAVIALASFTSVLGLIILIIWICKCIVGCNKSVQSGKNLQSNEELHHPNFKDVVSRDLSNQKSPNIQIFVENVDKLADALNPIYSNTAYVSSSQLSSLPYDDHEEPLQISIHHNIENISLEQELYRKCSENLTTE